MVILFLMLYNASYDIFIYWFLVRAAFQLGDLHIGSWIPIHVIQIF